MTRMERLGMAGKRALATVLLALVAMVGGLAGSAGASADPGPDGAAATSDVSIMGCQSTLFELYLSNDYWIGIECSGYHSIGYRVDRWEAGGWSGIIYYGNGWTWEFCDWDEGNLAGQYVSGVYLNVAKPDRCR